MPIKKPKPVKMPLPFADQTASKDDDARLRAIRMKRDLETGEGYSWNEPKLSLWDRIRGLPRHKIIAGIVSMGMAGLLVSGFLIGMDSGIEAPLRVIYADSWSGDRTSEDAIRDREERMDALRAQVEANRRAYEAEQARLAALEAERAAARQANAG